MFSSVHNVLYISTKLIVISLWLYCFVICEVQKNSPYELKFWEPNSRFDTRRALPQENKNKSDIRQPQKTRGKPKDGTIHHGNIRNIHQRNDRRQKNDRNHGRDKYKRVQDHNDKDWPRLNKWKARPATYDWNTIRSTRITPMYLRQILNEGNKKQSSKSGENTSGEALTSYSITSQIQKIMSNFPRANMTTVVIKKTLEYNDILLLKITEVDKANSIHFRGGDSKYMEEVPEKNIVFIVHGLNIKGITTLACLSKETYFTELISYYLAHLDKFDIFLMPMANPDGYQMWINGVQMWNKNLSPQDACIGVALDRNFDVSWNASKHITSCSQNFPGPSPFSEPETQAIREVFHNYSHKIIAYLNVHSGTYDFDTFKGDAVLYPRGFTDIQTDDDKYIDLKGEIDEAMKNANFQVVSVAVDTLHNWYGRVYGTSVDYASTIYGIPYAMELVMQLYKNEYEEIKDRPDYIALTEIWGRVINVIFNNIWKNTQINDV